MEDTDLPILNDLEELYLESHYDDLEWLSQHCPTFPPVQHTNLRSESNFNPVHKKSQFQKDRKNCTRDTDFYSQGKLLSNKFLEKGYPPSLVSNAFEHYKNPPGLEITSNNQLQLMRFTTQFHAKYINMESILYKH